MSAKSAVLLHGLLHDHSAQAFAKASENAQPLTQGCPVPGVPSELPSATLGWGLPEVLTRDLARFSGHDVCAGERRAFAWSDCCVTTRIPRPPFQVLPRL